MNLPSPQQLDKLSSSDKAILGKFYDLFCHKSWFDCAIVEHPIQGGRPVIEVKCWENPKTDFVLFKEFAHDFNCEYNVSVNQKLENII